MMTSTEAAWPEVPAPRSGLAGEWDRFIGPGATRAELALILGSALVGSAAVAIYALWQDLVRQHFAFVVLHVHPFLVAWLFWDGDWTFGLVVYGYLLLATLLILRTQLYLRRPVAMALTIAGLGIGLVTFPPAPGMAWFVPVFYLKLLVSHLLREWPYSPEAAAELGT